MELEEVQKLASDCLGCKTRPCSKACPMHTNIPEFIAKIKENKLEEAYNILIENNLFSSVCSKICPQENQCEGSCVRGIKGTPTQIGTLESFVNDWAKENKILPKIIKENLNCDKKVAIVGAGPAGLSTAYELSKKGINATVFERESSIGGILEYGIPDFRLEKEKLILIKKILDDLDVKFQFNFELGKDISIENLRKDFDFVFLGIGAEVPSKYSLSEEKLENVFDSDEILRAYNSKKYIENLGEVVVIGGGNVAMDSARAALHMGAKKVSILYRRNREFMPARKIELEEALAEGVEFNELVRVISAKSKNGKIEKLHCIKTQIIDKKAVDIENEEFDFKANSVIFAIGLKPNKNVIEKEGLKLTDWGTIEVDENCKTNIENVYAGGDVIDNKSVVCKALASGKKAANEIINKIKG